MLFLNKRKWDSKKILRLNKLVIVSGPVKNCPRCCYFFPLVLYFLLVFFCESKGTTGLFIPFFIYYFLSLSSRKFIRRSVESVKIIHHIFFLICINIRYVWNQLNIHTRVFTRASNFSRAASGRLVRFYEILPDHPRTKWPPRNLAEACAHFTVVSCYEKPRRSLWNSPLRGEDQRETANEGFSRFWPFKMNVTPTDFHSFPKIGEMLR